MALAHADTILSWFENVPRKEIPPQWMWSLPGIKPDDDDPYPPIFGDPLAQWWEDVEQRRKDRASGHGSDDDDEDAGPMLVNRGVPRR